MTTQDPSVQRVKARIQRRLAGAKPQDVEPTLKQVLKIHGRIQMWLRSFPQVMRQAQEDTKTIPSGWVWQDPFVGFFESYDQYQSQLWDLGKKLDALGLVDPRAKQAKFAIDPPRSARINNAISTIEFALHPETGDDHIVYPEGRLDIWFDEFSEWTSRSSKLIRSLM